MNKKPYMVSYNIGMRMLTEVLRGYWKRYVHMFRMDTTTLLSLCNDLEIQYWLKPTRSMNIIHNVYTIILGCQIDKFRKDFNIQVKLLVDALNKS
jgi:hypothetical protein